MFNEENTVEQMVLDTLRGSVPGNMVAGGHDTTAGCTKLQPLVG